MKATKRARVIGILAIIFASLGVLSTLARFGGAEGIVAAVAIGAFLVFFLHVVSGVQLLLGRPNAHRWVIGYAVLAIAVRIADVAIILTTPSTPSRTPSEGIAAGYMIQDAGSAIATIISAAIGLLAVAWTITYLALALYDRSQTKSKPAPEAPIEIGHFAGV